MGQTRKSKTFSEKILSFKSVSEKMTHLEALKILIANVDELMNAQNIELRDINNPLNSGNKNQKQLEVEANSMVRRSNENFDDVAFHLTSSASMFNNATQDSRMQ